MTIQSISEENIIPRITPLVHCNDHLYEEDHPPIYIDPGFFKTHVHYDPTPTNVRIQQKYPSRDALLAAEIIRRKNIQPARGLREYPKNEQEEKIFANFSLENRQNFTHRIELEKPLLNSLNIQDPDILTTHYKLHKNSPMNGLSFINEEGKEQVVSDAVTSSNDRTNDRLVLGRRAATYENETIAYTGRPDHQSRAEEQIKMMFLGELSAKNPKGITLTKERDSEGLPIYEFRYVVNSLITPSVLTHFSSFNEKISTEDQLKVLSQCKSYLYTIQDAHGQIYRVRAKPIFFVTAFNIFTSLTKLLPDFLSGKFMQQEIQRKGYAQLKVLVDQKIESFNKEWCLELDPQKRTWLGRQKQLLQESFQILTDPKASLLPEEEILLRELVLIILDLPKVYHCKSSTDRTGITLAIAATLKQWLTTENMIPKEHAQFVAHKLLKNPHFKELYTANLLAGHRITRLARGTKGTVEGKTMSLDNLGYSWSRGWQVNPVAARMMPERYLREVNNKKKIALCYLGLVSLFPIWSSIFYIINVAYALFLSLRHRKTTPLKYLNPKYAIHPLKELPQFFPKYTFDESKPWVGGRQLLNGWKDALPTKEVY